MVRLSLLALLALSSAVNAREVQVQLSAKNKGECGREFKTYFWMPRAVLPALGMPSKTCASQAACAAPPPAAEKSRCTHHYH